MDCGQAMFSFKNKRVLVTGASGFLGTHIVKALEAKECRDIVTPRHEQYDLSIEDDVNTLFNNIRPNAVIHASGLVGGIQANIDRPANFFYQNLMQGALLMHYAQKSGVEKFVAVAAGCGYPEHAPIPLKEENFWDGYPQSWSAPYSLAKRMLVVQAKAYYDQHGFNSVVGIPGNLYGSADSFNLNSGHVIPSLVRKFVDAVRNGNDEVIVWGTGEATRDFVYVSDVVDGLLRAAEVYDTPEIVNLSSGVESSIYQVVAMLQIITGFRGKITWDTDKPNGQLRRCFDVGKARRDLDFTAQVGLADGLTRTVRWYRQNWETARK